MVVITVEKSTDRKGYQLRHNQQKGWQGIIGNTWTWFKYKRDAIKHADDLMKFYNKEESNG